MKFTDPYIRNLTPETNWYEKTEATGLAIRVMPSGNKSWIYRFTLNSKRSKMTLGKYPGISLKQARELHLKAQSLKDNGVNPIEHEQQEKLRSNNTVENLALQWYANYAEKNLKRPITVKKQIELDIIPLLGNKDLEVLQTKDITKALDNVVQRGAPIHANRVLSSLKQMFNYAVSRGYLNINPASPIRARDIGGFEKTRERFLTLDEIKILWLFLDGNNHQLPLQTKTAIKILLLTGVRTGELRLAKWHEFDFEKSLWTIPAAHSKGGAILKVHLCSQAKTLLQTLKQTHNSQYLLPSVDCQNPLAINALPRAIKRIQSRIGIPEWTAHDLRRTFATQLGETLQIDPVVIEKCLGHKMPKIMATYNKNEMLPQRKEALEQWSACIQQLILQADQEAPQNQYQNHTQQEVTT